MERVTKDAVAEGVCSEELLSVGFLSHAVHPFPAAALTPAL